MRPFACLFLCLLASLRLAQGQGIQPVVAIHDSELTRALESMPATGATPTGAGTTGFQWWPTDWHYFVMVEAAKETLRSDGTLFTTVGDSNVISGNLLNNGAPKYPIVISLSSEAIRDDEIAAFTNYVAAGGFLFVGGSAFTRSTNGVTRGDFAFANALGVHMVNPNLSNWMQNNNLTKQAAHTLVNDLPSGALTWRMPSSSEEIPWGTSPSHPYLAPHDLWQVQAGDATVLAVGDTNPYLLIKPYGKGYFIYDAAFQPLLGHGGFAPGMYAYIILRRAIEWAFASASIPVPKLSPWPFQYDAAFMIRHDLENFTNEIAAIQASAQVEFTNGAKGDYYFCTGALRDDASPTYNTNTIVAGLRQAVTNYGATIGPHNGGLKNPGNSALVRGDYDYWHWGPDEVLDLTIPGYANGKAYASASVSNSFRDVESWLSGITNGIRGWVACYFNATREDSIDLQSSLNVKIAGDDKLGPFPHWTLSTLTPGKHYPMLTEPVSDWYVGGLVAQSLEPWHPPGVHTSQTMHSAVDFYYNLGALINLYSHTLSTGLGGAGQLTPDYLTYGLNTNLHPRVWSANAVGVYQWWLQRSNAQVTATFSTNGGQSIISLAVSHASDPNTSVEILLPSANAFCSFQVVTNGVVASGSSYRNNGQTLKVKVGTSVTNAIISYYPYAGAVTPLAQNFDGTTPPALPSGWTTTASGAQTAFVTENTVSDTSSNAAFTGDAAAVGLSELISPLITLPSGQAVLSFRNSYNTESTYDGGVLEIKIGAGSFTDIISAGGSFNSGGYNSVIDLNYSNPLAGRAAWTGNSSGFLTTSVNLPAAASGQTIQLKWRCGTDNGNGGPGWWIDSISISDIVCSCCGNNSPVLPNQPNRTIAQFSNLTVTNTASDPDLPPQTLTYQLLSPPSGASINLNGIITWTPGVGQAPSTNIITTVVTDSGAPPLSATNTFTVVVTTTNGPPVITSQPGNQNVIAGGTANFTVTASGSAPLSYQWRFNGGPISGGTTSTLTLNNVQSGNAGNYTVVVTNVSGSVTSAVAVLTLVVPPSITTQPTNQSVLAGNNVSFGVVASGTTPLSYQWLFNGTTLSNGGQVGGATTSSLSLNSVQTANGGGYSVVVTNVAGAVTSSVAALTVTGLASSTFSNNTLITIPDSGTATPYPSTITVTGMTGAVNKATVILNQISHTYIHDVNVLLVGPGGQNVLLMSHVGGALGVTNINLGFDDAAATSLPANSQVVAGTYKPTNGGGTVAFPGPAPAAPYGAALSALNGSVPNGTWSLYVLDDAAGDHGTISGGWSLTLSSSGSTPPAITLQPQSQTVGLGSNVVFVVGASGTAPLGYQWQFNGAALAGATTSSLTLISAQLINQGNYSAVVTNSAGSVTSSPAILTVIDPNGALFSDDFSHTGVLAPWSADSGTWTVGGGMLAGTNPAQGYAFAYITNIFDNYAVQAQIRFSSTSGTGGGIGARLNPVTGSHYAAWVYPENSAGGSSLLRIIKFQDFFGAWEYTNVTEQEMALASLPGVGTNWHTVKLAVQGTQIYAWYDGNLVASATDVESNPYLTGAVGVGMYSDPNSYSMFVDAVTVTPLPPALAALKDLYFVNQANTLNVAAPGVLGNDLAVSKTNFTASLLSGPTRGTLTFNSNGGFTYIPSNGVAGVDWFTYVANDGFSNSRPATVNIDVTPSTNVFYDDFTRSATNSNPLAPWTVGNGEWSVTNGTILGTASLQNDYSDCYIPANFTDFSIQAQFRLPSPSWACGLSARVDPTIGARYVANVYSETSPLGPAPAIRLIKFHNWITWSPTFTAMALVPLQSGSVGTGTHTLRLSVQGNTIDVYYDGTLMVHTNDNNYDGIPAYTSGGAGVHMYMDAPFTATFDNVTVTPIINSNAPVITAQPASRTNNASTTATFTVTASGSGLTYQWLKNGTINLSNGGNISGATSSSLSLANVGASDAGTYSVIISNASASVTSTAATLTVIMPPSIVTQPANQTNNVATTATFSVVAAGTSLTYQWLKNGTNLNNGGNISGATSSSVSLANVATTDAGSYSVVVSNSAGSVTSSAATLTVTASPVIVTQPASQTNNAGTTATFTVGATGTGLTYQWVKNGSINLSNGGSISGATTSSLSLTSVGAADAGSYSVVVSNTSGSVTSSAATLTVIIPPSIVTQPLSRTNTAGTTATFTVGATGSGLTYQWLKNGTINLSNGGNVSGATSSSLSLASVSTTDAGAYSVVVSNSAGFVTSSSASLTVLTPPSIVTQPLSQTNNAGSTATFNVVASGPGLTYQWVKNATVNLTDGGNISGATSSSLSLASLVPTDAGNYSVIVSNSSGSVTSSVAALTVISTPSIVTQPAGQTNNAGSTAVFFVSANGGNLSYQWLKNDTNALIDAGNISGSATATLTLSNLTVGDSATYSVIVSNSAGSITSSAANLLVLDVPVIVTQPSDQAVNAGSTATVTVAATGTALTYQWIKNGSITLVDGGNVSGSSSSSLSLANFGSTDAGTYSVVVSNLAGSATSRGAVLSLVVPPSITTQPVDRTNNAGTTAIFTVTANGTGLSYQWIKNGTTSLNNAGNVSGASSSSLSLANVTSADAGGYSVIISNSAGTITSSSAALTVINPPAIVTQPLSQTNNAGTTATFTVSASGTALTYQWLKNGTVALANGGNISGATSSSLSLANIAGADAGGYSVVVSNAAGSVTSSQAVLTVIGPPTIVTQPNSLTNNAGTTATFTVSASGTALTYQWVKNGTIALSNVGNVSGATSSSLSLANVAAADAGGYSVVVSNAAGSVTSSQAVLTVISPPAIVTQPVSQTNNAGTTATFSVSATGTAVNYQWLKNGTTALSNGGNVSGATSSSLSLANVAAADAGGYSVIVSNAAGSVTSSQAVLTVISPPAIVTQPISQTNSTGTTASFTVGATGGNLTYRWIKNGTNSLANGGNISGANTASLTISNLATTDAGTYSVAVTNIAGSATSLAATLVINSGLFSDDFSRTTLPPWLVHSGAWSITNGVLQTGNNTLSSYGNLYLTNVWSDYSVQAQIRFPTGAYGGGVGARLNPTTGAHYAAWLYPENSPGGSHVLKLIKFQSWTTWSYRGANFTPIQQVTVASVGTNFHTVKLTCSGNQLGVYYDGALVINTNDLEATTFTSGGVSIDLWTDTSHYTMSVDNVAVVSVPPGTPLLLPRPIQILTPSEPAEIISVVLSGSDAIVTWTSVPGTAYRLQYTEDAASANWFDVAPDVRATGATTSLTDAIGSSPQRFYRILSLPVAPTPAPGSDAPSAAMQ